MKYFSIDYWLDKVLLLSFLLNEQSKNGYCFVSGNEIKNWSMPSAIENINPVWFNPILNNSEVTSDQTQELPTADINKMDLQNESSISKGSNFTLLNSPSMRENKIQSSRQQFWSQLLQQFKAFTAEQINKNDKYNGKQTLTSEEKAAFIEEQAPYFFKKQTKTLTSDQTQELPTADINKMDLQNESSISKGSNFTLLNSPSMRENKIQSSRQQFWSQLLQQFKAFTAEQINKNDKYNGKQTLTSEEKAAFIEEQAPYFFKKQTKTLTSDQTQELPTADINKMDLQNESSINKDNSSLSNV